MIFTRKWRNFSNQTPPATLQPVGRTTQDVGGGLMTDQPYTHTVYVITTKKKFNFYSSEEAAAFANEQVKLGMKTRLYPYRPARSYVDDMIDRYNKGEIHP
jgi:hypothetical protein